MSELVPSTDPTATSPGSPVGAARPRTSRKIARRVALLLLGVLILGILFEYRRIDIKLDHAVAEAERDDRHWRLAELLERREAIPDRENSALVVKKAADGLRPGWPNEESAAGSADRAELSALMKTLFRIRELPANRSPAPEDLRMLRDWRERLGPNLEQARRLTNDPRGDVRIVPGRFYLGTDYSALKPAWTVGVLLEIDALLLANDGKADDAIDRCIAAVNAGRSIGDEPFLIAQLYRNGIVSRSLNTVARVLGSCSPSDRKLGQLQALLVDELAQPIFLYAMRGERAGMDDVMQKIESGELNVFDLVGEASVEWVPDPPRSRFRYPFSTWIFRGMRATTLSWMNAAVRTVQLPIAEQEPHWDALDERIVRSKKRLLFSAKDSLMPIVLLVGVSGAYPQQVRRELELRTMIALIAAERHRLETGAWPESFDAVDKGLLVIDPVDPFAGAKPLRILVRDHQFLVYSVSFNRKDDQGAFPTASIVNHRSDLGFGLWDVDKRRASEPKRDK